jgi:dephospho-CoA kinase
LALAKEADREVPVPFRHAKRPSDATLRCAGPESRAARAFEEQNTDRVEQSIRNRKPIVGLAGGIGSGKTTVAKILTELGAVVIDSDALAHLEINSREVKAALRQWWGDSVIAADGGVDRQKVASIVFRDSAQRHRLEALLHPRIAVRRAQMMADLEKDPRVKMIVLDSPLLYETDLDLLCDAIIFVDAREDQRHARTQSSRNWTPEDVRRREKAQQPLDIKRTRADYTCDNNSTLAILREQVERVFSQIVSEARSARDAFHPGPAAPAS